MFEGRREHARGRTILLVALWLGPSACVKDAPLATQPGQSSSPVETSTGPLLPLAEGNSWTYRVTKEGVTSTKVLTVEGEEEVGGEGPNSDEQAFKITTTKDGKADAVSWEAAAGKRFVRYREQELSGKTGKVKAETTWDPPRLVVDGATTHIATSASWTEEYAETVVEDEQTESSDEKDTWSVDAVDEPVTVPAGTFNALVLRRKGGSKAKTFWYVKGIGKVKEDGDELEELVSYDFGEDGASKPEPDDDEGDAPKGDAPKGDDTKGDTPKGDTPKDDDAKDDDAKDEPGDDEADPAEPDADGDADKQPDPDGDADKQSSDADGDAGTKPAKKAEVAP